MLQSFDYLRLKSHHNASERFTTDLFSAIHQHHPEVDTFSVERIIRQLKEYSAYDHVQYDACINSCCCFVEYPDLVSCPFCGHPRYQYHLGDVNNCVLKPYRTFDYLPISHRIKSMWASRDIAEMMKSYRAKFMLGASNIRTDYWDSDLYKDIHARGMLTNLTDMGFLLTADGVSLFQIGSFEVWPIFLINLNLPPLERVKEDNILSIGFIPGPKAPVDLESFLRPLVDELHVLLKGYKVHDAHANKTFTLRGSVVLVSGDMPAMAKLMAMKGPNAYSCCRYCNIRGIYCKRRRHVYCPLTPPTHNSSPRKRTEVEEEEDDYLDNVDPDLEYKQYDPRNLPMRNHVEFIRQAVRVTDEMNPDLAKLWGINHLTILSEIPTLEFPRLFVIDIMHLLYEGLSRIMVSHWSGDFFPKTMPIDNMIKPKEWEEIGRQMKESRYD